MALFDSFQALVGRAQSAARLFVRAGGFFNVGDVTGGTDGTDITGAQLKYLLLAPMTRTSFTMASAIQTVSVLPSVGLVDIFYPSATTSVKLPTATVGGMLMLRFAPAAVASQVSILPGSNAAGSVQSIVYIASDLSMIHASFNGANSGIYLKLICATANEWAVADSNSWGLIFNGQRSS